MMLSSSNELLILGCGHSESDTLFNNNALVTNAKGNLLIDCGYTIKPALHAQGFTLQDIDAVFITHVHADHMFGLERLANEGRYKYRKKARLILHQELYDELWHQCLKGVLAKNGEGENELADYFELELLQHDQFEIFGNSYQLHRVSHTPGKVCFGLMLNNTVFYSGDTVAIPQLLLELKPELIFHDVTLTDYNPVHASVHSLLSLYPPELCKKIYLMSYEDHWPEYQQKVEQHFAGFARQGQRVALNSQHQTEVIAAD
jgi:glyoxylase-like metal-dependent hydrolase (beta-lactamase superfamily II)